MNVFRIIVPATMLVFASTGAHAQRATASHIGIFTNHGDVGAPSILGGGSVHYDPVARSYTITGGGENMWATADHFHYVWIKLSGDVTLEADVAFTGTTPATGTPDPHRKACLVVRQTLERDSPYADAATHGDGLTSLQWRDAKGAVTHEVQANVVRPARLRIEKRGDFVSMSVAGAGEALHPAGGAARLRLTGDYYVGLAVSAHDSTRLETATFTRVALAKPKPLHDATSLISTIETINLRSKDRRVAYTTTQPERIVSAAWFPDSSKTLFFRAGGRYFKVQADVPGQPPNPNRLTVPQSVDAGTFSMAVRRSDAEQSAQPLYRYGASKGQIWRAKADGMDAEQLTHDDWENRDPHLSPDGKLLAFLSYPRGTGAHRTDRDVRLRVLTLATHAVDEVAQLLGGDGTFDGQPWSPNSQYLAFVTYQRVPR